MANLLIFGFHTSYVVAAALVLVVLLVAGLALVRRGRRPRLVLRDLTPADVDRYLANFAAAEREFVDHPAQAAARARGLVEEVMRRRGYPDRLEPAQRIADLGAHDRTAAKALEAANNNLKSGASDTEKLRLVVQGYRTVLIRLTGSGAENSP
ncbi:MAG: hypothetical protein NVSMB17_15380 [Candidatus Dormibacteria bacterium]